MATFRWYACGLEVVDRYPGLEQNERPLCGGLWLSLLNCGTRGAKAALTFLTARGDPTRCRVSVAPQRAYRVALHSLERRAPSNTPFALLVEAEVPLSPEVYQSFHEPWEEAERAVLAVSLRPLASPDEGPPGTGWLETLAPARYRAPSWVEWSQSVRLFAANPWAEEARPEAEPVAEAGTQPLEVVLPPGRLRELAEIPGQAHGTHLPAALEVRCSMPLMVASLAEARLPGRGAPVAAALSHPGPLGLSGPSDPNAAREWLICVPPGDRRLARARLLAPKGTPDQSVTARALDGSAPPIAAPLPEGAAVEMPLAPLLPDRAGGEASVLALSSEHPFLAAAAAELPEASLALRVPLPALLPPYPAPGCREWRTSGGLWHSGGDGGAWRDSFLVVANASREAVAVRRTLYLPREVRQDELRIPAMSAISQRLSRLPAIPQGVPLGIRLEAEGPVVCWRLHSAGDAPGRPRCLSGDLLHPITDAPD